MNKSELSAAVASKTGLTQAQAESAVNGVIDAVTETLKKGDDVRLVGFGTFSVSERSATTGRNPRTGETINIAASKQAKFKAGQALKLLLMAADDVSIQARLNRVWTVSN